MLDFDPHTSVTPPSGTRWQKLEDSTGGAVIKDLMHSGPKRLILPVLAIFGLLGMLGFILSHFIVFAILAGLIALACSVGGIKVAGAIIQAKEYHKSHLGHWSNYNEASRQDPAGSGFVRNTYAMLESPSGQQDLIIYATPLLHERKKLRDLNDKAWELINKYPLAGKTQEMIEKDVEYQRLMQAARKSSRAVEKNEKEIKIVVEKALAEDGTMLVETEGEKLLADLENIELESETRQQMQ